MAKAKAFRVTLTRMTVSTAVLHVDAKSERQAIFLAGQQEPAWNDDVGEPELTAVEVESAPA